MSIRRWRPKALEGKVFLPHSVTALRLRVLRTHVLCQLTQCLRPTRRSQELSGQEYCITMDSTPAFFSASQWYQWPVPAFPPLTKLQLLLTSALWLEKITSDLQESPSRPFHDKPACREDTLCQGSVCSCQYIHDISAKFQALGIFPSDQCGKTQTRRKSNPST